MSPPRGSVRPQQSIVNKKKVSEPEQLLDEDINNDRFDKESDQTTRNHGDDSGVRFSDNGTNEISETRIPQTKKGGLKRVPSTPVVNNVVQSIQNSDNDNITRSDEDLSRLTKTRSSARNLRPKTSKERNGLTNKPVNVDPNQDLNQNPNLSRGASDSGSDSSDKKVHFADSSIPSYANGAPTGEPISNVRMDTKFSTKHNGSHPNISEPPLTERAPPKPKKQTLLEAPNTDRSYPNSREGYPSYPPSTNPSTNPSSNNSRNNSFSKPSSSGAMVSAFGSREKLGGISKDNHLTNRWADDPRTGDRAAEANHMTSGQWRKVNGLSGRTSPSSRDHDTSIDAISLDRYSAHFDDRSEFEASGRKFTTKKKKTKDFG